MLENRLVGESTMLQIQNCTAARTQLGFGSIKRIFWKIVTVLWLSCTRLYGYLCFVLHSFCSDFTFNISSYLYLG